VKENAVMFVRAACSKALCRYIRYGLRVLRRTLDFRGRHSHLALGSARTPQFSAWSMAFSCGPAYQNGDSWCFYTRAHRANRAEYSFPQGSDGLPGKAPHF